MLRAHTGNLAEKDATEKSDAAREAFLAELALEFKKGTADISKHSNNKLKDKIKSMEHRKTKYSRGTSISDQHASSNDPVRSFIGREKHKRPLWSTDALDKPIALETGMDISPIEEVKVSLIDETAVDQELDLSYEQVDTNEHETSVEFAAYEEAQESLILDALTDPQRVRTPAVTEY
ncbi:hypothetical protein Tco_0386300 [Tanacetum coccineum]